MSAQTGREPGVVTDGTDPGTPGERLHGTAVPAHDRSRPACARTRPRHDGCELCFYCEAKLAIRNEHDHFPIPASAGGTETVPVCLACHDRIDRDPIDAELALKGWQQLPLEGRLFLSWTIKAYWRDRYRRENEAA